MAAKRSVLGSGAWSKQVYVRLQITPAASLPGGRAATSVCIHSPHLTFKIIK